MWEGDFPGEAQGSGKEAGESFSSRLRSIAWGTELEILT